MCACLVYFIFLKNFSDRPQVIVIAKWSDKFVLIIPDLNFEFKRKFVFIWSMAEIDLLITRASLLIKVRRLFLNNSFTLFFTL